MGPFLMRCGIFALKSLYFLYFWWAGQDSNLQPDRYERSLKNGFHRKSTLCGASISVPFDFRSSETVRKRCGRDGRDPPKNQTAPSGGAGRGGRQIGEGTGILQGQSYSRFSLNLQSIARALGGEVSGKSVRAPGPGHSKADRSLSVTLSAAAPDGFIVHSFAGDLWPLCRDHVRAALGGGSFEIAREKRGPSEKAKPSILWPALWRRAVDPRDTLAERYLNGRGLDLPDLAAGEVIRFDPHCQFGAGAQAERHPAVVCLIRNIVSNRPQGIQRTALAPDGAPIKRNGKTLRMSLGDVKGGAIKLDTDEYVAQGLCIGEGAESCLAGRQLGYAPVWALISASGIAAFPVLPGIYPRRK
jgi:putative DNA primase/helicase